ncbi:MAG: TIGR04282 family arsenosugar biosynthesis glycosyltransferase [Desulfovibrio sp.]|nr:TIGR04282 family arsenosugar biosynthesis glycosyltransferase [Desulfovibrio sp.]MBI4959315.1 TIGR04282 family arsenosugar biosynthesis glycosyltransferase [Desulfovibrio sp.]
MNKSPCLLLMLRSPRLGRVKTRLARDVGDEAALALYKAFVQDMLQALDGCGADIMLWVEPAEDVESVRDWLGNELVCLPQPEGDLGVKMDYAFKWAFEHGYAAAAVLGSDIPQLSPRMAKHLIRLIKSEPAVLGPSPDGGYWTIGFQSGRYLPEVFANIPWSTPDVFERTQQVLHPLEPAVLPELADMDTLEDLRELIRTCPPGMARRTLALAKKLA